MLSKSELSRLKASSVIVTPQVQAQRNQAREDERNAKLQQADKRKQMMMQKEKAARDRAPQTEAQIIAECRRKAYADPITERDLTHDSAKTMETLGTRAETFVIRKSQLTEKIERDNAEKAYNDRWERQADYIRIKEDRKEEERQKRKIQQNLEAQGALLKQIAAREHQKMMDAEEQEQEKERALIRLKDIERQEVARAKRIRMKAQEEAAIIAAANSRALAMKEAEIQQEIEQDKTIIRYQRKQAAKEIAREKLKAEERRKDELLTAKLRAQQEKSADSQAEQDAERAQRHVEKKEREARRQEAQMREKKSRDAKEMRQAAKEAAEERALAKARELDEDYREAMKQKVAIYKSERTAVEQLREQAVARKMNQVEVRKQMEQKQREVSLRKQAREKDALAIKKDYLYERFKQERVREEKLKILSKKGVGPEYVSEFGKMTLTQGDVRTN